MENIINAIKAKAGMLEAYADIIKKLADMEHWYQHIEGEGENEKWVDDEYDSSKYALAAIRESIKAVKKLAGV